VRQRDRRDDRAPPSQGRRRVRGQTAPHRPRRRVRAAARTPVNVRARLTLWHAGVLALVICVFAAGTLVFVKARLDRSLADPLRQDLAAIEKVYREETGDLGELGQRVGLTFEVTEGATVIYRTPQWPPTGPTPFRLATIGDAKHRTTAARDETALRRTLRT